MNSKALQKLSYGLFVLTTNYCGKDNGCIINTASQSASEPLTLSVAVNKANYTCEMISKSGIFTISTLNQDASFDTFRRFGFQSGRNIDKFENFAECKRVENGCLAVTSGTNSYISVKVKESVDLGSHILFIGEPTEGEIFNDIPSATYAYYFEHIKPKSEKPKSSVTVWRCQVCGYEYVGEELPADFICPLCKHPASDFVKITS